MLPDHAPEAVHSFAPVLFQLSVDTPPLATEPGLAFRVTVGVIEDEGSEDLLPLPPPHDTTTRAAQAASKPLCAVAIG